MSHLETNLDKHSIEKVKLSNLDNGVNDVLQANDLLRAKKKYEVSLQYQDQNLNDGKGKS